MNNNDISYPLRSHFLGLNPAFEADAETSGGAEGGGQTPYRSEKIPTHFSNSGRIALAAHFISALTSKF